ncbi:hypothetical protein [Desulfoscipio gibsoniae]|uniref:Uncharacterized protein n=1 Tax=Desulfoscipio gibsoniae DSM 7213 TaxID=767817 RepID=R4KD90_9FIRM|nr:hypothetical protein [Desulfoscipio gibsoniae]AGL00529.1 hypothetical protein Desgi_0989 [Desulfoscipio gibsoniae DSM 7213]
MEKNITGRADEIQGLVYPEIGDRIYFHGKVKDSKGLDIDGAIVLLLACFTDGIEKPLAYTFSDQEGEYLISIPRLSGYHDLLGYKVRAGKPHIAAKVFNCPDCCQKTTSKEPEPDTDQDSLKESTEEQDNTIYEVYFSSGQDKITKEINFCLSAEDYVVKVLNLVKVGDSECHWKPSEEDIGGELEDRQASFDNSLIEPVRKQMEKFKDVSRINEYTFSALPFLMLLSLFGFVITQKKFFRTIIK